MKNKITIAISARNAEKEIISCLNSIKRQTIKPKQVFIIVDTKDDTTIPVAKKYNFRVLLNPKGKLYNARNVALKNCKTEFLAFTDSDCVLNKNFIKNILNVFKEHPEVGAGTGRHPPYGKVNWVSWLHHMWYLVETWDEGYVEGVIGANSYFRVSALKKVGGWSGLKLMAAEDVNVSQKLTDAGYKIWLDEKIIVYHKGYRKDFKKLWNQSIKMGHDIVIMMQAQKRRNWLYYYTLLLPVTALLGLVSVFTLNLPLFVIVFGGTLLYWILRLRSIKKALPRYIARWILIFPYSIGILKGFLKR
ncbi:MAG: glycosyltransferase [Candidatus Aenigmatarchaeota archaeon]